MSQWSSSTTTIERQLCGVMCAIALLAFSSVACGRGSSPLAPSPAAGIATPPPATVPAFSISGTISNATEGGPLSNARVEIVSGDSTGKRAVAGADGRYRIDDLPSGAYSLRASADGFDAFSASVTLGGDKVVDFALSRPTGGASAPDSPPAAEERWALSGTVTVAASQSRLAGVRVELTDGADRGRVATTDSQGRYAFAALHTGTATIRATRDGFVEKSLTVTLQADHTLDFSLEGAVAPGPSGPEVSGRTVDILSEQPVAGVNVRIDGAGDATTDGSGAFTLAGAGSGGTQRVTLSSASTIERQTQIRVTGEIATLTLIPRSLDLRAFDEMFRARGGLHRWMEAPRLVVQRRVLRFTNTSDMSYVATSDTMSDADTSALVADLTWALPQLTGGTFSNFAGVDVEIAMENEAVSISRPGVILVARYEGLGAAISAWGYGRWAWNGAGVVQAGAIMLDNDFELSPSPYRRSLRAHELGHTLGYDHVSGGTSVMNISGRIEPTTFDRDATKIAFRRQPLNTSPDVDPDPTTVSRTTSARALTWDGAQ
jgi:hypothetical protein